MGVRADSSTNNTDIKKVLLLPQGRSVLPAAGGRRVQRVENRRCRRSVRQPALYGQKYTNLVAGNVLGLPVSAIATVTAAADLRPERQTEIEGGIDATLFKGRANIELTVYQKGVKDLLLTKTLTPTAGFAQLVYNGPSIRNRGLEVGLNVLPIQAPNFQWNVRGTLFANRCKVVSGLPAAFQPISFFNFAQFGTTQLQNDSSCTQVYANDSLGRLPGDAALGAIGTVVSRKIGDNSPTGAPDFPTS